MGTSGGQTESRASRDELLKDPEIRRRYEEARQLWEQRTREYRDAVRRSERIDEKDLAIVINAT